MPTTRLTGLALSTALAAALLTGCSGGGGGDTDSETTPQERLQAAADQLNAAGTIDFTLASDSLPDDVTGLVKAEGQATHAPAFSGDVTVTTSGVPLDTSVIAVDGKVWAEFPVVGYREFDIDRYGIPDPANLMSEDGLTSLLPAVESPEAGDQTRDGEDILTPISGTLSGEDIASVIPSADTGADFDVTFRLDDDDELRSATMTGPFYGGDPVEYDLTISTSEDVATIDAP